MKRKLGIMRKIVLLGLFLHSTAMHAAEWTHGIGGFISSGEFGEATKTITRAITFQGKVQEGPWSLKASSALISLSGPGSIDSDMAGARDASTATEQGMGDVFVTANHAWVLRNRRGLTSLYGKMKIPLASSSAGLGTGEFDWELGAEGLRSLAQWGAFAKAGYRWRGDRDNLTLDNGGIYSAGLYRNAGARIRGGASYEWRAAVRANSDPAREVILFVERRNLRGRSVTMYAVGGDSAASVDLAVGVEVAWRTVR